MVLELILFCSHEVCGEGCEEEVNVDVHQLPQFPLLLFTHFPPFAPGIPRIIVLLSRQFCLHDYDDLRRWVMSMGFRSSCIYSLRCCSDIRAEMIMSLLYSFELRTSLLVRLDACDVTSTSRKPKLTHMLNSLTTFDLRTKVSPYSSLKHLHHEAEQRACQGSVPSAFGTLVADEGVLSLHLQELKWH